MSDVDNFFVVPFADNHNLRVFVIRFDKHPPLILILDRNKSDHCRIHPSFFLDKIRMTFFLAS